MTVLSPPPTFNIPDMTNEPTTEKDTENKTDKKDKKEEKPITQIPQKFAEMFIDNIFKSIAIVGGEHWKLTPDEKHDAGLAFKPVAEKYAEQFLKWFCEINFALLMVRILITKGKKHADMVNEKKAINAEEELDKKVAKKVMDLRERNAPDNIPDPKPKEETEKPMKEPMSKKEKADMKKRAIEVKDPDKYNVE